MCGKPHPEGFRTVLHPDRVCRAAFWIQTAVYRRRREPNGNQVFAVTLRRRHHDVKNGVTACSASKADPGCSSFVPLCVPEGQFVSSGQSARRYIESDRVEGTVVYDARGHRTGEVK